MSTQKSQKTNTFLIYKLDFLQKKRTCKQKSKPWTKTEDEVLKINSQNKKFIDWESISSKLQGRTKNQCKVRWERVLRPGLNKGKWTDDEDRVLKEFVQKNGTNKWNLLSKTLLSRTSKQIRDRWINNLDPKRIDFVWDKQNDSILLENFLKYGFKWTQISKLIKGSTENLVKNRFYSLLRSTANDINLNGQFDKYNNKFDKSKCRKPKNLCQDELINYIPYLMHIKGIKFNTNFENKKNENIHKFTDQNESTELSFFKNDNESNSKEKKLNELQIVHQSNIENNINSEVNNINFMGLENKLASLYFILHKMDNNHNQTLKTISDNLFTIQTIVMNKTLNKFKKDIAKEIFLKFKDKSSNSWNWGIDDFI